MLLRLALRNLLRQWRRSALSLVSVVAGVAVIVLGRSFVLGFTENIVRAQVDTVSGHVQAVPADYPTVAGQHPLDALLRLTADDAAWLDAHTAGWTRRVLFTPRLIKGRDAVRARATGFDPATDASVFPRKDWTREGCPEDEAGQRAILTHGLARAMGLQIGDRVVLEARTAAGALNALEVEVCGLVTTGNPGVDRLGLFAPMALVDELVRPEGATSHLALRLDDRGDADAVAAGLQARLGGAARVETWEALSRDLVEVQALRQKMLDVIAFVLLAMAATGIANTVLMATYERVREIGTLMALGLSRGGVVQLFVLEGLLMGAFGGALGVALTAPLAWRWSQQGIDLSSFMAEAAKSGSYDAIPVSTMLYLEFSPATIGAAALFGVLVATAASFYPAVLASRLPPAEAVRA